MKRYLLSTPAGARWDAGGTLLGVDAAVVCLAADAVVGFDGVDGACCTRLRVCILGRISCPQRRVALEKNEHNFIIFKIQEPQPAMLSGPFDQCEYAIGDIQTFLCVSGMSNRQ